MTLGDVLTLEAATKSAEAVSALIEQDATLTEHQKSMEFRAIARYLKTIQLLTEGHQE